MDEATHHEREVRAARNQAIFRAVNERLQELHENVASLGERLTIACECANRSCAEMLTIGRDEYEAVRDEPRRFAVLPRHVWDDVEDVVGESDGYVVVEKKSAAAEIAEILDERRSGVPRGS